MYVGGAQPRGLLRAAWLAAIGSAFWLVAVSGVSAQPPASPLLEQLREQPSVRQPAPAPSGSVTLAAPSNRTGRLRSHNTTLQLAIRIKGQADRARDQNFHVTDGEARITTGDQGESFVELPAEGRSIVSADADPAAAAPAAIAEQVKTALPWIVLDTRRSAGGGAPRVLAARPFLQLARAIVWDPASQRYTAEVLFGLDPEPSEDGDIEPDVALEPPFQVRFSVSCDDVAPAEAAIRTVGPVGYSLVRVSCSAAVKNEREEQYIEVRAGTGSLRYVFELPHRPGPPILLASASSLPGLGLGVTTLTVKRVEEDGTPLAAAEPISVQLLVNGSGAFVPSTVSLARGQREVSVELRPSGLGRLEVTAVSGELRSQPLRLELRWPWFALFAAGSGAVVGAFLGLVRSKRKRSHRRNLADVVSGGMLALASLFLPELAPLPDWARPTEIALFLVAAVGAFIGLEAFDALARRVLPNVASKDSSAKTT